MITARRSGTLFEHSHRVRDFTKSAVGSMLGVGFSTMEAMLAPFVDSRELSATIGSMRNAMDVMQRGMIDLAFSVFSYEPRH
jgi:hypothetical protein